MHHHLGKGLSTRLLMLHYALPTVAHTQRASERQARIRHQPEEAVSQLYANLAQSVVTIAVGPSHKTAHVLAHCTGMLDTVAHGTCIDHNDAQ